MHLYISKECIYTWGKTVAFQEKEGQMFCQVCLYKEGWFSIGSSHQAGTLPYAPSSMMVKCVESCAVPSSSRMQNFLHVGMEKMKMEEEEPQKSHS